MASAAARGDTLTMPLLRSPFLLAGLLAMTQGCAPDGAPAPASSAEVTSRSSTTDGLRSPAALTGHWQAWLDSPGGELAFGLELREEGDGLTAALINGSERIAVPRVELGNDGLLLAMDHYDSTLTLAAGADGQLSGTWTKRRGADAWTTLNFGARRAPTPTCPGSPPTRSRPERWEVRFAGDAQPAVGLFDLHEDGCASGTFLTTTGDYRYLAGSTVDGLTTLSCFDGAHAFLFRFRIDDDGALSGDFWSRDAFHDTFTGRADSDAHLPDGFGLTHALEGGSLSALSFPDLTGTLRALDDPAFAGQARIIQVFGSWCPNCQDACAFLAELQASHGPRGLSILGLAFELTGDFDRDAAQVQRYAERHGVTWPLLVAGLADKAEAGRALPLLDAVRSYPTTIFLHGDGRVRAVYQGFSGPATGAAHDQLRAAFIALVDELLAEAG